MPWRAEQATFKSLNLMALNGFKKAQATMQTHMVSFHDNSRAQQNRTFPTMEMFWHFTSVGA